MEKTAHQTLLDKWFNSAATGNLQNLRCCLQEMQACGKDVDVQDINSETALYIAAKNNQLEIARYLLDNNANVNLGAKQAGPLEIAIYKLLEDMVRLLVRYDADINLMAFCAPFHNLLQNLIFNYLDRLKESIDSRSETLLDPRRIIINILLNNKADLNIKNPHGETALYLACTKPYKDIGLIEDLIKYGADVTIGSGNLKVPLYPISKLKSCRSVAFLMIRHTVLKKPFKMAPEYLTEHPEYLDYWEACQQELNREISSNPMEKSTLGEILSSSNNEYFINNTLEFLKICDEKTYPIYFKQIKEYSFKQIKECNFKQIIL